MADTLYMKPCLLENMHKGGMRMSVVAGECLAVTGDTNQQTNAVTDATVSYVRLFDTRILYKPVPPTISPTPGAVCRI